MKSRTRWLNPLLQSKIKLIPNYHGMYSCIQRVPVLIPTKVARPDKALLGALANKKNTLRGALAAKAPQTTKQHQNFERNKRNNSLLDPYLNKID